MANKRGTTKVKEKTIPIEIEQKNNMEKVLIENFVSLQRVMTNLALKFENLSGQLSKLLELFEISAKTLAEKGPVTEQKMEIDPKITEKLNSLLDQNRVIAKGVAMLYEKSMPEEQEYPSAPQQVQKISPQKQYNQTQQQKPTNLGFQKPTVDFSKTQKFGNLEA
jgi:hypothetical protein